MMIYYFLLFFLIQKYFCSCKTLFLNLILFSNLQIKKRCCAAASCRVLKALSLLLCLRWAAVIGNSVFGNLYGFDQNLLKMSIQNHQNQPKCKGGTLYTSSPDIL